ncbi:MAG: B-box zinc finger protein [Dehalococcoidales bacterium]|nr:B-box zinc finger protein [Dehalococcoidales bacterium]
MDRCKRHPDKETSLTCNKCGDPICPRCMVQTPVGMRCPTCAKLSRLPTYQVTAPYYLRAILAGAVLAVVCGVVWGFLQLIIPFFFFNILIAAAAGYGIGEGISILTNRKRGTGLIIIAGVALVLSYLIGAFTFWGWHFRLFDIVALAVGVFVTTTRLR